MARAFAPFFISELMEPAHVAFKEHEQYMKDVYCNVFAARLLVPAKLVREEMTRVDLGRDIVSQLAGVFWVSRTLMNRRLRDILSGSEY
jgi:Zn-dependent peptidase ImmA (M78 family)